MPVLENNQDFRFVRVLTVIPNRTMQLTARARSNVSDGFMECGGRAQRRRRFRLVGSPRIQKRRRRCALPPHSIGRACR